MAKNKFLKGTELEALLYKNFNVLQICVIGQDLPVKKLGIAALIQNLVE